MQKAGINVVVRDEVIEHFAVIPAGNEPKSRMLASVGPWRMPRGSNTPLLAAGYLTDDALVWHGGMNLLGKEDAWDNLIRIGSAQVAAELLAITFGIPQTP